MTDVRKTTFAHRRSPDQDRAEPAPSPDRHRRRRAGRSCRRARSCQEGPPQRRHRQEGQSLRWLSCHLLVEAHARDHGPAGRGAGAARQGRDLEKGKVFFDTRAVYEFDLLPESGHRMPAFINLQQYYFEHDLHRGRGQDRPRRPALAGGGAGPRQRRRWRAADRRDARRALRLTADWVIAADGARSTMRRLMRLGFEGRVFQDQFLICDIKMTDGAAGRALVLVRPALQPRPVGAAARQADDVWRLDFQVGDDADRDEEMKPENVARRVRAMLGEDIDFTFEWISLYRFQSRRLERFRHGRVIFAGDAAHQMSPVRRARRQQRRPGCRQPRLEARSGACAGWRPRGCSTATMRSASWPPTRTSLNTTRSTDFISPKGAMSRIFRDGVLALAEHRAVRAPPGQLRAAVDRHLLRRLAAQRAGRVRGGRMPGGAARRCGARCAARGRLAAGRLGEGFTGVWFSPTGRSRGRRAARRQRSPSVRLP